MSDSDIKKIISGWKKEENAFLKETNSFFLKFFLPSEYIYKIDYFIQRDNTFFADLIVDAECAYAIANNLLEVGSNTYFDEKEAPKEADRLYKHSPYRCKNDYYEVALSIDFEEFNALYTLFVYEQQNNPSISIDDLFKKFIDCYSEVDYSELRRIQNEAFDELDEDERPKN